MAVIHPKEPTREEVAQIAVGLKYRCLLCGVIVTGEGVGYCDGMRGDCVCVKCLADMQERINKRMVERMVEMREKGIVR